MLRVYISFPMVLSSALLDTICNDLKTDGILGVYHTRGGVYSPSKLHTSDVVIIVHPENKFKFSLNSLPNGVKREYNLARAQGKKVFLCYIPQHSNTPCFYETEEVNGRIEGLAGTTGVIYSMNDNIKAPKPISNMGMEFSNVQCLALLIA